MSVCVYIIYLEFEAAASNLTLGFPFCVLCHFCVQLSVTRCYLHFARRLTMEIWAGVECQILRPWRVCTGRHTMFMFT